MSIVDHIRRGYKPHSSIVILDDQGHFRMRPADSRRELAPGLVVYRFAASLYYANANHFGEELRDLVTNADPPVSWFCLDAAAIEDVDYSAGLAVQELHGVLHEKGIRLVFVEVVEDVRDELRRYGVEDLVGSDAFYASLQDLLDAYRASAPNS
jgi:MFS superfamily sulfate permease-like transporter